MENKNRNIASTSNLIENLVSGSGCSDFDPNDPIINFLIKDEYLNWQDGSDEADSSDDSDIGLLIEEHILREKLKQVSGPNPQDFVSSISPNSTKNDKGCDISSSEATLNHAELVSLKLKLDEAMQINWKMREDLIEMEKKLVNYYREACGRKQNELLEERITGTKLRFKPIGFSDRFYDRFRSPYFKLDGSSAPLNDDCSKLADTNFPLISLRDIWDTVNIESLTDAVRKFLIYEKSVVYKLNGKSVGNKVNFSRELLHFRKTPTHELVRDRSDDSLNWQQIITYIDNPSINEKDCLKMWTLYVKNYTKKYTEREDFQISEAAKKYNLRNWDKIAEELDIGRSPFECFLRHQENVLVDWSEGKWSKEEENYLKKVVEYSKIGDHISWDKITFYMDSKVLDQLYSKWSSFLPPGFSKGQFSELEDKVLLAMTQKGANFREIANVLKNRSVVQLNARYRDHLLPQLTLKLGEWSYEEDEKLLELVRQHGESNWADIARDFKTRSRVQIRHRHKLLKNKLALNPNINLSSLHRPRRPTSQKRTVKMKKFFKKITNSKSKNIKTLLKSKSEQPPGTKKVKSIDLKLSQYYQLKFASENVDENHLLNRYLAENHSGQDDWDIQPSTSTSTEWDSGTDRVNKLTSSLYFSLIALINMQESVATDDWSDKDRSRFRENLVELASFNQQTRKDLTKWHQTFCSLFAAPALMSNLDLDQWIKFVSKEK